MKKRILLISDNKILGFGGGSLEEHKYYDGLNNYVEKHNDKLKVLSIDKNLKNALIGGVTKSRKLDIMSRMCGHSSYMYFNWKKYREKVLAYNPDIVVLGRSRMGFIAKDIKSVLPECKVICNMENIEYDYVTGYFANKTSKAKELYEALEKWCVKRDEKDAIKYADALNYLTRRDYIRAHELYNVNNKYEMILPICIERETVLSKKTNKKTIVFIGSLNYGSNVDAVMNFIQEVWMPRFSRNSELEFVIGGSNPNDRIKQIVKQIPNCLLYENFASLEEIVPIGSMVIAPIQKGAGMKVKVAETLSMGLMITASDEALVGYEKALELDRLGAIIRANTIDEYKKAIIDYCNKTKVEMTQISAQNKQLYHELYSYDVSRRKIAELCEKML